jgi:hypothetical protein
VLQPYELVQLKRRPVGLVIHTSIHAIVTALLVAPFLPRWWLLIPLLSAAHYWVDGLKVTHGPQQGLGSLLAFLGDQAVHLILLAGVVLVSGLSLQSDVFYGPLRLTATLYYAVPFVAASFAGAILLYQVAVAFSTRPDPEELLLPRMRVAGIVERLVTLTVVLFLMPAWWWLGAVSAVAQVGANHRQPRRWVETVSGFAYAAGLGLLFR